MGEEGTDKRRVYYDHEPAYRAIADAGGEGWDDLPGGADDSLKDEAFGSYEALQAFLDSDDMPAPTRALEIGCGGGQASLMLAERGFDVVGVDYAETAVELARRNAEKRDLSCEFRRADVTDLPFEDSSFGLVIDNHCLHCLVEAEDRRTTLSQIARVLEPGGTFFGETMSSEGDYDPQAMGVDPETGIDQHHVRIWVSADRFRRELREAGFEIVSFENRPQEPKTGDCLVFSARL